MWVRERVCEWDCVCELERESERVSMWVRERESVRGTVCERDCVWERKREREHFPSIQHIRSQIIYLSRFVENTKNLDQKLMQRFFIQISGRSDRQSWKRAAIENFSLLEGPLVGTWRRRHTAGLALWRQWFQQVCFSPCLHNQLRRHFMLYHNRWSLKGFFYWISIILRPMISLNTPSFTSMYWTA